VIFVVFLSEKDFDNRQQMPFSSIPNYPPLFSVLHAAGVARQDARVLPEDGWRGNWMKCGHTRTRCWSALRCAIALHAFECFYP
jgi:hypothetical protein